MIKIIVDSTADFTAEQACQFNIDIVPLKVIIEGKEYRDRVDLQPEIFYQKLQESESLPTTSQPTPHDFLSFFQEAKEKSDDVIVLTLSSAISGTYQSAHIAKDLIEYDHIYIIDSLTTTLALQLLVMKAIDLRQQNMDIHQIVETLEIYKKRIKLIAFVDTLEYLYKGGRLSKTAAIAGNLLKFKPLIGFDNGHIAVYGKARGLQKTTQKLIEFIHESGNIDLDERVAIGYTGNDTGLKQFESILQNEFHFANALHGCVGPVIGTHAGPGARFIAYIQKENNN